jgi:mono/diheme cytochrome c family protein
MNLSCIARRTRRHVSLAVAAIFAASPFPLTAQEIGDVAAGKRLAETWCSSCHVVAPSAQAGASTGVPTFTAVASMPSTTPIALRVYLQTPHARMPDLHLSRDETDNLIAYILSLRGH